MLTPVFSSVLDLSARPQESSDIPRFHTPSTPSSPNIGSGGGGLGDLRTISRRGWSKSADDLSKVSPVAFPPVKTSFQERIAEYRGRSDSSASAASPTSPGPVPVAPGPVNGRHPFPTLSPSTSPPRSSTLPPVAISISDTSQEGNPFPRSTSPTHVHIRSHSFTPKLPSKLASPRYLPSPQRSAEREYDAREVEQPAQGTPTRAAFGFGLGGINNSRSGQNMNNNPVSPPPANNRVTALLPPPIIIEPGQVPEKEDSPDSKRASQIIFHSGFINRLADVPANFNHATLPLSKGWKSFKLELKGSKLYFYKPPGDRANAIKDLFPVGLVPPTEEEDDPVNESNTAITEDTRKARGRDDAPSAAINKKKRAYWGRRTHPNLVCDEAGVIEKGTFEALVHEAAFATTFGNPSPMPPAPSEDEAQNVSENDPSWKSRWYDFASSVIFALPSVVGRQTFEIEFMRCCSYLITGAQEEAKEEAKSRVAWLANDYLRYHNRAADISAWEEWKRETIPDVSLSAEDSVNSIALPSSASTQAVFQPSPIVGSDSPNVNLFSPRPTDAGKMVALMDALKLPNNNFRNLDGPHSPRSGLAPPGNRFPWDILKDEGLTREVLLNLDPFLIARSLTFFHRWVLEQCPTNISAEFILGTDATPSTYTEDDHFPDPTLQLASLLGSEEQPHWLTKLLLLQILGADSSNTYPHYANAQNAHMVSPTRRSEDRGPPQTSRTHSRSELISAWVRVGELCRTAGDECSWRAIAAALCSRPIARLDKAWKRVNLQAVAAIESWSHYTNEAGAVSVTQPQITPWGGDIKVRAGDELARAHADGEMVQMDPLSRMRVMFDNFRKAFLLCPRKTYVPENEVSDDVRRMVSFWKEMAAEGGGMSGLAVKMQRCISIHNFLEPYTDQLFL